MPRGADTGITGMNPNSASKAEVVKTSMPRSRARACQAIVVRDQRASINQSNRGDQGVTGMTSASRTLYGQGLGVVAQAAEIQS